jgi:hypothetical protein
MGLCSPAARDVAVPSAFNVCSGFSFGGCAAAPGISSVYGKLVGQRVRSARLAHGLLVMMRSFQSPLPPLRGPHFTHPPRCASRRPHQPSRVCAHWSHVSRVLLYPPSPPPQIRPGPMYIPFRVHLATQAQCARRHRPPIAQPRVRLAVIVCLGIFFTPHLR